MLKKVVAKKSQQKQKERLAQKRELASK